MRLFNLFKKKNKETENTKSTSKDPVEIADRLEALGYFKYAAPNDVAQLKLEIGKTLAEDDYLPYVESGSPYYRPMDPRHYNLDGETLFEHTGITESLKEMNPLFDKMNIRMEISDHLEEYDITNQWLNHEITINGKKYVIFDKFEGYGWGEVAQRFSDMINHQLALQGSDERMYLIHGANDGRAVFLTDKQFAFLDSIMKDPCEKPLRIEEWCREMVVKYLNIIH